MKKHNFYAGPSILSEYTIKNTADAVAASLILEGYLAYLRNHKE